MDEIEIPEAIRDSGDIPQKSNLALALPLAIGGIFCLGTLGLLWMFIFSPANKTGQANPQQPQVETVDPQPKSQQQSKISGQPEAKSKAKLNSMGGQTSSAKAKAQSTDNVPGQNQLPKEDLLGHLPYEVASQSDLAPITADGSLQMQTAAAAKFQQMQTAAQAEGINLMPISAFRTTEAQEQLFFEVKEQKVQAAKQRAEVSAPPGYSEHHTGYAVDIGDGDAPATNVEPEFANTATFRWLKQNALKYSFELSFPPNNEQGVSYEPWHWRYVGDRQSLETFYKARN